MTKRVARMGGRRTGARTLPSYTVATVPNAVGKDGQMIYVSNGTTNKRLGISDGTAWRFPDGATLS